MAEFRVAMSASIERTCRLARENSQLDQTLCKTLAECLEIVNWQITGHLYDSLPPEKRKPIVKELYRIVHKAEMLVRRCCEEAWWETAFTQACLSHREEIADILQDLQWCLDLLFEHVHVSRASIEESQVPRLSTKAFTDELPFHEKKDLNHLLAKLEDCTKAGVPDREVQVLRYLLEKVRVVINLKNDPAAEFPQDFWKFDLSSINEKELGTGAAGVVYQTRCFEIPCAKKIMPCTEDSLKACEKQANRFAMMGHPHVMRLFCFIPDTKAQLAQTLMELMDKDLYQLIKNPMTKLSRKFLKKQDAPFSTFVAVDIMIQLVKGIGYLHKKGVAHRDLKSVNILVGKAILPQNLEGYGGYVQVKVADFDQAKILTTSCSKPELQSRDVGTTAWRAPEAFKLKDGSFGMTYPDKADIYSFGMICFEILSGVNPIVAMGIRHTEVHEHILKGVRPRLPVTCPNLLSDLVFDCWRTEPLQRPEASEVQKRLLNIQSFLMAGTVSQYKDHQESSRSFVLGTIRRVILKQQAGLKNGYRTMKAAFPQTAPKAILSTNGEIHGSSTFVGWEVASEHPGDLTSILQVGSDGRSSLPCMMKVLSDGILRDSDKDSGKTKCGHKNVKMVVGLDFGTTHTGVAFAKLSDPDMIYTLTGWPAEAHYCKTLTAIYYKAQANEQFSWGYQARDEYEKEVEKAGSCPISVSPVDRFADDLYSTQLKRHVASRGCGTSHPSSSRTVSHKVVVDYLKEVVNFVLDHIRRFFEADYPEQLSNLDMIQWCVTVPSSWTLEAKDQMRRYLTKAGLVWDQDDLHTSLCSALMVLEPEAALMHCYKEVAQDRMQPGDKLVVVDVGGGSVQVMVQVWRGGDELTYEVAEDACSSIALCGDELLESGFFRALSAKVGCLESCMKQCPSIKFLLLKQLERLKYVQAIPASGQGIKIPDILQKFWRDTSRSGVGGKIGDWLELSPEDIKLIFDSFVNQVLEHVVNQLSKIRTEIKFMFVVGGFAQLIYLLEEIKNRFRDVQIVTPRNPGSVVCRGAVALGLNLLHVHEAIIEGGSSSSSRGGGGGLTAPMDAGQTRHNVNLCDSRPGSSKSVQSSFPQPPTSSSEDSKGKGKMHFGRYADSLQPVTVVVGLDFGTIDSRYAYALQSSSWDIVQSPTIFSTEMYYKKQHGSMQVHSVGHAARDDFKKDFDRLQQIGNESVDDIPDVGTFLTRFKLHLADSDGGTSIASDVPPGMTVRGVISDYLREVFRFILADLHLKYGQDLTTDSVQWCVTVPSIWDDNAKQQMKACVFDTGLVSGPRGSLCPSVLVLEPESASRGIMNLLNLQIGDRLLVADIGGGTCDIIVQEWIGDSKVKEVTSSKGGLCGSSYVDRNFLELMSQRIGKWLIEYVGQSPTLMLEMLETWERIKCSFCDSMFDHCCSIEVQLPTKLASAWEDFERRSENPPHRSYDVLEISQAELRGLFDPVVKMNLDLIADQLSQTINVKFILLVGGFANSEYLMTRVRERFSSRVEDIIRPPNPEGVISQGAVALALTSGSIVSRVARKTYGLEMNRDLERGVYPTADTSDNGKGGLNKFRIDVQQEKRVDVNSCVSSIHCPVYSRQQRMRFTLYSSSKPCPIHTMEGAVTKEWEFEINISDSMELGETPEIKVSIFYGRSSIEVHAVALKFGKGEGPSVQLPVMVLLDYQHGKGHIDTSLARRTYGLGSNKFFEEFDSPSFQELSADGKVLCKNRLEIYIKRGTKLNRWISRTYFPIESNQEKMAFTLYSSIEVSPRYVTEDTIQMEEEFEVDIRKGQRLDKNREFCIRIFFEYRCVTIEAIALNFAAFDKILPIRSLSGKWDVALGINLNIPNVLTLATSNNLGSFYKDQGKLATVHTSRERALIGEEKAGGLESVATLATIKDLGNLYNDQEKFTEVVEAMYQRALTEKEKSFGLEHASTLDTINNLGIFYNNQGKLAEAEVMYNRALVGKEKILGSEHTSTLDTINHLGILYNNQGKLADAEVMFQRALVGREKALGPEHTSTLNTVNNLGILYYDKGKLEEAEVMYKQTLVGREKALGLEHTLTLDTVNNLGILYNEQGKLVEAEVMYNRALVGREKVLGPEHTLTLDMVHQRELNDFEGSLGDFDKVDGLAANDVWTLGPRWVTKRELKDLKGSLVDLDQADGLVPNNVWTLEEKGVPKFQVKDLGGLFVDLDRADGMQPNDMSILLQKGVTKRELKDLEGSLVDLDEIDRLEPNNALTLGKRGVTK